MAENTSVVLASIADPELRPVTARPAIMPHGAVPYPFGDCRICADRATGVHYGVATCEGCKGFFKRSIPKADRYKCFFGGSCVLSPQNRNRCKACRYQRCLQAGMSTEAVKMGRIPKVEKERALKNHYWTDNVPTSGAQGSPNPSRPTEANFAPHHPQGEPASLSQSDSLSGSWDQHQMAPSQAWPMQNPSSDKTSKWVKQHGLFSNADFSAEPTLTSDGQSVFSSSSSGDLSPNNISAASVNPRDPSVIGRYTVEPPSPAIDHQQQGFGREKTMPSRQHDQSSKHLGNGLKHPAMPGNGLKHQAMTSSYLGDTQNHCHGISLQPPASLSSNNQEHPLSGSGPANDLRLAPFCPDVIKELLVQIVDKGQGAELEQRLKNKFLTGHQNSDLTRSYDQVVAIVRDLDTRIKTEASDAFINVGRYKQNHLMDRLPSQPSIDPNFTNQSRLPSLTDCSQSKAQLMPSDELLKSPSNLTDQVLDFLLDNMSSDMSDSMVPYKRQKLLHDTFLASQENAFPQRDIPPQQQKNHDFLPPPKPKDIPQNARNPVPDAAMPVDRVTDNTDNSLCSTSSYGDDDPLAIDVVDMQATLQYISTDVLKPLKEAEKLMKLQREGHLPIHPLNQVNTVFRCHMKFIWNQLMISIPACNERVLTMCSAFPLFAKINPDDQKILIKEAYFDIWLITNANLFADCESYLRFPCNATYTRWWMSHILPESLIAKMFDFTDSFQQCQLTDVEMLLVCAIQLINPDRSGLEDRPLIKEINNRYLDILAYVIKENHDTSHGRVLIKIFRLLPALEPINIQQAEVIGNFSIDNFPESIKCEDSTDESIDWDSDLMLPLDDILRTEEERGNGNGHLSNGDGQHGNKTATRNGCLDNRNEFNSNKKELHCLGNENSFHGNRNEMISNRNNVHSNHGYSTHHDRFSNTQPIPHPEQAAPVNLQVHEILSS